MAARARPEMNMKHFWQRQLLLLLPLLLLLQKHSQVWVGGEGLLKSVIAKTNMVADIIVGHVNCLQFD